MRYINSRFTYFRLLSSFDDKISMLRASLDWLSAENTLHEKDVNVFFSFSRVFLELVTTPSISWYYRRKLTSLFLAVW